MKNSQLHIFLSQLKLEEKVVFRDKDKNTYAVDFHKDIKQRIESILPDAVYIFNSQPLILFFDLTIQSSRNINTLYKKVWSFDNTSIIFLIKDTGIEVFNALNYIKEENTLEPINLSDKKIKELFNIWELESGNTWKWFQKEYIEKQKGKTHRKRVNERLFSNIKEVRNYLTNNENLNDNESNSLILRIIFIRYLIDRKIKIDDTLIPGDVENLNDRRKSFIQLIREPQKLNELFTKLNNRFNGVLFKENDFVLTQSQSDYLAGVFAGELDGDNSLFKDFFFEIFDFSIIPVEVISGIYESLIDDEKRKLDSAVYTPSFLVDYILKDTVDEYLKNNSPEECTVFEVAVGSGIFLVQSLRRMIEKEIDLNGNKDKILFSEKIKSFAEKNLYGIDINPQALKVTCFSIYIALLDYLEPADINIYQFPKLIDNNLFESNFFGKLNDKNELQPADFEEIIKKIKPKFVLGNPPWKSKKDDLIHTKWIKGNNKTVGYFEIAQSFLLRVKDFMSDESKSALILTSTMFYNVSLPTRKFKKEVLHTYCIDKFFDLSAVKQSLFETQESPTSIIFFRLSKENEHLTNIVKHHSLKVNSFLKNFKMLVIEKFDQKEISQKYFIDNQWMFKVALYGNTLDYHFLNRISQQGKALEKLINNTTLFGGAGIKSNYGNDYAEELIGLPLVENNDINCFFTPISNNNRVLLPEDVWYESGRNRQLFLNKKILIKEQAKNWSQLVISYCDNRAVYKNGVNGISSNNEELLKQIFSYLISDIYTYYIFSISSGWGVATRPQTRWKEEYLAFPIIEIDLEVSNQLINLVNELLNPLKEFYKNSFKEDKSEFELTSPNQKDSTPSINQDVLSKINDIIYNIYSIKDYEKDLIDYVLNVSRYQFKESEQNRYTKAIDKDLDFLKKYADVYLTEFSDIYSDEFIQVEVYPLKHFIAMNFVMKDEKPNEAIIYSKNKDIESVLKTLANTLSVSEIVSTHDTDKNLFIQKDIKGFEKDSFYIIKPNEYKCWHRAMAWYDVAEFKEAIQKAEINDLNGIAE
ncbi:Eco57I restriction-modification methylase domain-containing protein [Flavobacterium inviolabile]|uniref:Eco57I restriction-modification methylase domain-containing protein n=1 Tax=Flavobacterium inviolabile TaxID=2748320 RepID=UPI0015AAA620|nr:DNA methyltransferase [Flavobacterium inviolabile]